jgi:hypothetical protein
LVILKSWPYSFEKFDFPLKDIENSKPWVSNLILMFFYLFFGMFALIGAILMDKYSPELQLK